MCVCALADLESFRPEILDLSSCRPGSFWRLFVTFVLEVISRFGSILGPCFTKASRFPWSPDSLNGVEIENRFA